MDIQAYEEFLQLIDSMAVDKMDFRYESEKERGICVVKNAVNTAKELGNFGERRIALENLLDNLSEVGLFLSAEQIDLADKAFGKTKNKTEQLFIDYYKAHLLDVIYSNLDLANRDLNDEKGRMRLSTLTVTKEAVHYLLGGQAYLNSDEYEETALEETWARFNITFGLDVFRDIFITLIDCGEKSRIVFCHNGKVDEHYL
ncbi:MAG: hypothetical protein IJP31_07325 [Lachnospiraceae bacterium]|nr:hypothetical protein [Lachnospiraceae bacterium]